MTLAAHTREEVRRRPFLYEALRAGVLNYSAAARFLDVGGDRMVEREITDGDDTVDDDRTDAIVAALRRYATELPAYEEDEGSSNVRVRMKSGLGPVDGADSDAVQPLLVVGDLQLAPDGGTVTGIVASGDVDPTSLAIVLQRLAIAEISVEAAGVSKRGLVVAVDRRDGADALRLIEDTLSGRSE